MNKKAIIGTTFLFVFMMAFIMGFNVVFGMENILIGISTITAVAGISELVSFETIRVINTCCVNNDFNFSIVAFSDGTGEATVERLSGNALKLA